MQFKIPTAAVVLAMTSLVAASPLVERQGTVTPPAKYYLQTKVVGDIKDCGSNKDGLWLYSYHTGAGLGDAALSNNKSWASPGYLNHTQQLFTLGTNLGPWPFAFGYGAYQGWVPTTISIAGNGPVSGFFFNSSGLQINETYGGWLACDWWHGVPQLFALTNYNYGPTASACSEVELHPVAV